MSDFDCTLLASITSADNALALNTLQTNVLTSMRNDLDFAGGLMNKLPSVNSFSMRSEFRATINKVVQNLDKHLDLANRASNQKVFEIAACPDDKIEGTVEQGSNSFGAVGVYQNTFAYNKYKLGTKNLGDAFHSAPADPIELKSLFMNDAETYSQFPIEMIPDASGVTGDASGNTVTVKRMISASDVQLMYNSSNFKDDYSNSTGDVNKASVDQALEDYEEVSGEDAVSPTGTITLNASGSTQANNATNIKDDSESGVTLREDYDFLNGEVFINSSGHKVNLLAYAALNGHAILLIDAAAKGTNSNVTNFIVKTDILSVSNGSGNGACGGVNYYYINQLSNRAALTVENHDRTSIQAQNCPPGAKVMKLLKTLAELKIDAVSPLHPVTVANEDEYLNLNNAIAYSAVVASAQGNLDVLVNRNAIMSCAIKTNRKFLQALYDNVHGNAAFAAGSYANLCDC
jgi:hypothetical protein